ncbi:hypothetical protein [Bacteroides sp.]
MNRLISCFTGLSTLSRNEKGRILLYLVTFVPLIYKLFSPFFILAGTPGATIVIIPTMITIGIIMCSEDLRDAVTMKSIIFYLLVAFVFAVSPVFHSDTTEFVEKNYWKFVSSVLPYVFVGFLINYERDWIILRFVSRMGILVQIFWQACLLMGLVETELGTADSLGEQMESGYQLLFPILVLLISISREKTLIDILASVIGIFLLFFMGARGPIVVFLVFVVGYLVIFKTYNSYSFVKKLGIITGFVVIYSFLQEILLLFIPIAEALGFSTRVFDSILNNRMINLEEASNRDEFYGNVFRAIYNDPTGFGYGWGADRLFTPTHGYVHNLELELLCQFGYIGGTMLLFFILYIAFRRYQYLKKENNETVWFAFFCLGFVALQFSYTYVQYPLFFVFIGYIMNTRANKYYNLINI